MYRCERVSKRLWNDLEWNAAVDFTRLLRHVKPTVWSSRIFSFLYTILFSSHLQCRIPRVFVWLLPRTSTQTLPLNNTWTDQEPSKQKKRKKKNCLAIECNCGFAKVSLCLIRIINHAASLFSKDPPSSRRSRWDCGMVRKTKALITLLRLQSVKSTTQRSPGRPSRKPSCTGW